MEYKSKTELQHAFHFSQSFTSTSTMSSSESEVLPLTAEEQGYVDIWNASFEFVKPMVMRAAIVLGIPDVLHSKGPLTLDEIAKEISSKNTDFLHRILRFLVVHRVFSQEDAVDPADRGSTIRKYGLTDASKWLVMNKEKTLVPYILLLLGERSLASWQQLHKNVLEDPDSSSFTRSKIYEHLAANPSVSDTFNQAMAARSRASIDTIVKYKNVFEGIKSLVDVGGGIGLVTSKLVEAFPSIHGVNFDLPHVIATAPVFPGVEQVSGDMFEEVPSGDAILLKMVLHGHGDEACKKILNNCYKSLPYNGKLVVVDFLINEEDPTGYACDMLMGAISTHGRDRTEGEWIRLLTSVSFLRPKFRKMILDSMCIIEAFKS